jgi:predicted 3-demethylubiquinone-9 3-methyltransferase (glyoxalase superfamily)
MGRKSISDNLTKKQVDMEKQIIPFLTFQKNNAEQAMNYYTELFDNSKIIDVRRYEKGGPAKEGTVMMAVFELNGRQFICSDSYVKHEWTFSPAISLFIECKADGELEKLFAKLSDDGKVFMPLDYYGFG